MFFYCALRYLANSIRSKGKLICYYSDQRDNATYGQTMVHQVSTDLKNWGPVVEDVTYPTYTDRPGMPVVTKVSYTEDTDSIAIILCHAPPDNANISSSRTVNTSISMNMALSSVPQATPSLSTTACRPTPKISLPPQVSVSLSRVVLSRHLHRTPCGHHTVVKMALSSPAPVHRVICSLTKLLAKESGQRSLRPKNTATHGLYVCCQRMEVDTWL